MFQSLFCFIGVICVIYSKTLQHRSCDIYIYLFEVTGFPGGSVVKNLPANAGDTGSIPGPGRSHMHGATKSVCLEPVLHSKRSYHKEKPAHCN